MEERNVGGFWDTYRGGGVFLPLFALRVRIDGHGSYAIFDKRPLVVVRIPGVQTGARLLMTDVKPCRSDIYLHI